MERHSFRIVSGESPGMVEDDMEIFDNPIVKLSSIEITNALNTLQNLCLFYKVGNDLLELLQRFESFHVHDAARKQPNFHHQMKA